MIRVILLLGAVLIVGTLAASWIARRKYWISSSALREIAPSTERRARANGGD